MELGISIFGVLVLVLLLLAFFSAIFAIAVIFALVASIFFTWSILLKNIESFGVLDAVFLSSVSIFLVSSFITLFGKFTIVPPKVYQTFQSNLRAWPAPPVPRRNVAGWQTAAAGPRSPSTI